MRICTPTISKIPGIRNQCVWKLGNRLKYFVSLLFRLCAKTQEYIMAYFKSEEFLDHYQTTSEPLVKDLQTALDDDTFSKYLMECDLF
jgi:hypothetical protein